VRNAGRGKAKKKAKSSRPVRRGGAKRK